MYLFKAFEQEWGMSKIAVIHCGKLSGLFFKVLTTKCIQFAQAFPKPCKPYFVSNMLWFKFHRAILSFNLMHQRFLNMSDVWEHTDTHIKLIWFVYYLPYYCIVNKYRTQKQSFVANISFHIWLYIVLNLIGVI